jgi:hypothetical protein
MVCKSQAKVSVSGKDELDAGIACGRDYVNSHHIAGNQVTLNSSIPQSAMDCTRPEGY